MNKEEVNKEYWDWVEGEKRESQEAYQDYRKNNPKIDVFRPSSFVFRKSSVFRKSFTRIVAAAVLVVVLGLSVFLSRDKIFNLAPKYTEEQIALSYEHTLKTLAVYSSSLNKSFEKLQSLSTKLKQDDTQ
ncbi:MAG: hypothetical protein U9N86_04475 [Bacteroidota bacterium]|nr:hypothetical protein [Bacteroidota bacterium]